MTIKLSNLIKSNLPALVLFGVFYLHLVAEVGAVGSWRLLAHVHTCTYTSRLDTKGTLFKNIPHSPYPIESRVLDLSLPSSPTDCQTKQHLSHSSIATKKILVTQTGGEGGICGEWRPIRTHLIRWRNLWVH